MRRHQVPAKVFYALAAGGGGAHAVGHLQTAQYSKRLLLLCAVRDVARRGDPVEARRARQAFALLAEIQRQARWAVDAVVRHPAVGAWARDVLLGSGDTGGLAELAAAAAVRAGFPRPVQVVMRDGAVVLPSLGRAMLPEGSAAGGTTAARQGTADRAQTPGPLTAAGRDGASGPTMATVRPGPGRAEVIGPGGRVRIPADPHRDAPGWHAVRHLEAEYQGMAIRLLLDDVDPYRLPEAGVRASRPDEGELDAWRATLRKAWRLLVRRHWTTAEEVAALTTVLTPLTAPDEGLRSATSTETFGAIGVSAPPDDHSLAVSLAHEVQHAKLGALIDLVPLTRPDDGRRFYAPWRDDPRPIGGLIQGVYAHVGVAGYWRRQRLHEQGDVAMRAHADFARWRDASVLAARTLQGSGLLTPEGELFMTELTRTLSAWCHEPVPAAALDRARAAADEHRERWRRRNGEPVGPTSP
ncbi:HEXXH motif domain-containing protein [Actinoallomurus sp. CA-150999]|uniref:HEXXH motif domain-containing protein n=1 Tax=Actinoallomurus sp. CA-150999 TaxID=3239887 RepID=UPI003D8A063F